MSNLHALTVPKWGMSMEEGEIAEWQVAVGDQLAVVMPSSTLKLLKL